VLAVNVCGFADGAMRDKMAIREKTKWPLGLDGKLEHRHQEYMGN
jgi:hypothetical protein